MGKRERERIRRRMQRLVTRAIRAEGWRVSPAGGDLGAWDLIGVHPERGMRLLAFCPTEPEPDILAELVGVRCHPACLKEVWVRMDRGSSFRVLTLPHPVPLTFTGLDRCDACGAGLDRSGRLSGLCSVCAERPIAERFEELGR